MKRGLILINAYCKLASFVNQAERLKTEFNKLGVEIDVRRNDFFAVRINKEGRLESIVKEYDFCVYLDKDKYMSAMLEKCGMRLFNSHSAIRACDDKMTTQILLSDNNIAMPPTLSGLLCYDESQPINEDSLKAIVNFLGLPLVVKTSYGSLGKGVFKADDFSQLTEIVEKIKCAPHLFQKFVSESAGTDMRVIVIGGKFVGAMLRKSQVDFRSNIELGGKGEAFEPPAEVVSLCEKVARLLRLDYCGIDILQGKEGYYVCEVNSNAFFGGIESVSCINIAKAYCQYIYQSIYEI